MKSKNILLAGLAVSALAAATGAHALNLSGTTVGTTNPVPVSVTPTVTPYYVASEATIPVAGLTGNAALDAHLTTGSITSGTFLVTYSLTGATFNTSGITNANLSYSPTPGTSNTTVSTISSSSVSFIVTVSGAATINDFIMNAPLVITTPGAVSVTASVTSGGIPVDNGPFTATIINFAPGYAATVTGATNQIASIASNFKAFKSNGGSTTSCTVGTALDCLVATIGTLNVGTASTPTGGAGIFKSLLGSTAAVSSTDVSGATVTVTGILGSTEAMTVGATTVTPGTAVNVAGTSNAVTLTQAAATAAARTQLAQSTYSITATPVLNAAGLNAAGSATSTLTFGSVLYEGVNFNAAWVGDGVTNASQDYRIRIGNRGGAISGAVQATLLNPSIPGTSGTVFSTAPCTVGTGIPAAGSLTISSAALKTCFGAFGNSDLLITVQGSQSGLSAKMRVINSLNSLVTEQSLGFGVTVAIQQ